MWLCITEVREEGISVVCVVPPSLLGKDCVGAFP